MPDEPSILSLLQDLDKFDDEKSKDTILKVPFAYPGGKSKSVQHILPLLPYRDAYIEPFGGSAAVLLSRHTSKLEVFNDRYAGVVAFYRVMRDKDKMEQFSDLIDLTIHSREDFVYCHETWETAQDDIQRAFRWYYMSAYSFGSMGRNFGRATSSHGTLSGKIINKLELFPLIHERFRKVQIENQDWYDCLIDYDRMGAVFYCDPPYLEAYAGAHKHIMTIDDHHALLTTVFNMKAFVAMSGYSNPLYEEQPWDNRYEWESFVSLKSAAYTEGNKKAHLKHDDARQHATEVLWIKEAKI